MGFNSGFKGLIAVGVVSSIFNCSRNGVFHL